MKKGALADPVLLHVRERKTEINALACIMVKFQKWNIFGIYYFLKLPILLYIYCLFIEADNSADPGNEVLTDEVITIFILTLLLNPNASQLIT